MEQNKNICKKYMHYEVYEVLPVGWKIDHTTGSPLHGYDFCTNGVSILRGGKRALVKTIKKGIPNIQYIERIKEDKKIEKKENYIFPTLEVNLLARKKFQEHLLKDIIFDLMVCEIEGWDKKEYIKELTKLINSIEHSLTNQNKHLSINDICCQLELNFNIQSDGTK